MIKMNLTLIALSCFVLYIIVIGYFLNRSTSAHQSRFEEFQEAFSKQLEGLDLIIQEEAFNLWEETDHPIEDIIEKIKGKKTLLL